MTVSFLLACVTSGNLAAQATTASCDRSLACEAGGWADFEECRAETRANYDAVVACYAESCTFYPSGASYWLSDVRSAECDSVLSTAADVGQAWEDCDNAALGECLLGY